MANKASAISIVSGYGIKPVQVDGVTLATVLKFAVKKNSLLHMAYWAAFNMHDFNGRPKLYLQEQDVCKNKSNIRLYCMAQSSQGLDLWAIYDRAQILVREAEIANLKREASPEWVDMFWNSRERFVRFIDDELPF
jgi:hypothetical protein